MADGNFKIIYAGNEAMAKERALANKEGRKMDYTVKKKAQEAKRQELRKQAEQMAAKAAKQKPISEAERAEKKAKRMAAKVAKSKEREKLNAKKSAE